LFEQTPDPLDRVARLLSELVYRRARCVFVDEDARESVGEPRAQSLVRFERREGLDRTAGVTLVGLPLRLHLFAGLVAPCRPAGPGVAGEHLQVRTGRATLDQVVLLVGLAGVLTLAGLDHVDRRPGRLQGPHGTLDTEQDRLSDVAEVEADPAAVRSAVLAALGPDDIGDVPEAPRLQDIDAFEQ